MRMMKFLIACFITVSIVLISSANAGVMRIEHSEKTHCALSNIVPAAPDQLYHSMNQALVKISIDWEQHDSSPVQNDKGCCAFGAACQLKCFGAALTTSAPILFPHVVTVHLAFAAEIFQPFDRGLPPFRPPRI